MVTWTGIGVEAHSTLGGQDILLEKYVLKLKKKIKNARISHASCPKNYQNIRMFVLFARYSNNILESYTIFAGKMP